MHYLKVYLFLLVSLLLNPRNKNRKGDLKHYFDALRGLPITRKYPKMSFKAVSLKNTENQPSIQ